MLRTSIRIALAVFGVVTMIVGARLLVSTQDRAQWLSALCWLAAVVVVHDGVLMPLLALRRLRRQARRERP